MFCASQNAKRWHKRSFQLLSLVSYSCCLARAAYSACRVRCAVVPMRRDAVLQLATRNIVKLNEILKGGEIKTQHFMKIATHDFVRVVKQEVTWYFAKFRPSGQGILCLRPSTLYRHVLHCLIMTASHRGRLDVAYNIMVT